MRYTDILNELKAIPYERNGDIPSHVSRLTPKDDAERLAVRWYTDGGSKQINSQLRGHAPEDEPYTDEDMIQDYGAAMSTQDGIANLDRIIAAAPKRKRAIKLYRGEANVDQSDKMLAMEIGASYVDPSFLSTSFDPAYAFYSFAQSRTHMYGRENRAISMYLVPPSVPGAFLHFSDDEERSVEREFLLVRGCRYTLREKRDIPVKNPNNYRVKEVTLLIWDVAAPLNEDVAWGSRVLGTDVIVWVDAEKVRASWQKDRYSYFDGPDHPNAIKGRLPRFGEWIKQGIPVNPPEVVLSDDGEIVFTNGRHRFTWMLAHGETRVPVATPPEYAEAIEQRFGASSAVMEERKPPALYPAVLYQGKKYPAFGPGETHFDALDLATNGRDQRERQTIVMDGDNRGFVNETGRWLNRAKAADYARSFDLFDRATPEWRDWMATAYELSSETPLKR